MPKKFIPCGGPGGDPQDITTPTALVSVHVWSDGNDIVGFGVVYGISFTYVDEKQQEISTAQWGSEEGKHHKITLGDNEKMEKVYGTTDGNHVTSLTFVKSGKNYGPYGAQSDHGFGTFSFPPNIVGFFVRSSNKLNAIGAYADLLPLA